MGLQGRPLLLIFAALLENRRSRSPVSHLHEAEALMEPITRLHEYSPKRTPRESPVSLSLMMRYLAAMKKR